MRGGLKEGTQKKKGGSVRGRAWRKGKGKRELFNKLKLRLTESANGVANGVDKRVRMRKGQKIFFLF